MACILTLRKIHLFAYVLVFLGKVSLCSSGCSETGCSIEQAGIDLNDSLASASLVLRLEACTTSARLPFSFLPVSTSD